MCSPWLPKVVAKGSPRSMIGSTALMIAPAVCISYLFPSAARAPSAKTSPLIITRSGSTASSVRDMKRYVNRDVQFSAIYT